MRATESWGCTLLHFAPRDGTSTCGKHQRTTCELGNVGDTTNDTKHNFQTRTLSTSRAVTASIMTNLTDARCKSPRNAGTHCIKNAQVRNSSSRSTLSKNDRNRPGYCSGCQPKNWNLHFVAVSSKKCNLRQNHFGETIELLVVHTRKQRLLFLSSRFGGPKRMGTDQSAEMWTQIIRSRCPNAVDNLRSAISQPVRRFWRPIRNPHPKRTVEDHEARNCIEGVRAGAVGNACIPGGSLQELVTISRPSCGETKIVRLVTERRVLEDTLAKVRPRTIVASMR